MKSKSMGANPLEPVIAVEDNGGEETKSRRIQKERATFHISVDLMDRARNIVYWTPGMTLASLAEHALKREINDIEKKRGEPFPPRARPLGPGRPMGR